MCGRYTNTVGPEELSEQVGRHLGVQIRESIRTDPWDVRPTDPEPLPVGHPLWGAPGALITPHIAGDSPTASRNAFTLVGEQVRRYVRGEALANVVEVGY